MRYYLVLLCFLIFGARIAKATDVSVSEKHNYLCFIAQYDYKTKYKMFVNEPIEIKPKRNGEDLPGKAVAHFHGVVWFVNFYDQKISIDAQNVKSESLALASAPAGSALSLQLPSMHQIIVCNKKDTLKVLLPSTEDYGGVKTLTLPKPEKQDDPTPPRET